LISKLEKIDVEKAKGGGIIDAGCKWNKMIASIISS